MPTTANRNDRVDAGKIIDGYAAMIRQRVDAGWSAQLVTPVFRHLPGRQTAVLARMFEETDRVYRTFLTRAVRRPTSMFAGQLPMMIVAPDAPAGKAGKPIEQVSINDGLHVHGVLVVPPGSRLRVPVAEHFRTRQSIYVGDRRVVERVDVRLIERDVERAVAYALKSVRRGRYSLDDVLVLPRALAEVRDAALICSNSRLAVA